MDRHLFRPMRSNRTRCDVCGRTAGVLTHRLAEREQAESTSKPRWMEYVQAKELRDER